MPKYTLFSFIWQFVSKQKIAFFFIFLVSLVWSIDNTLWPYLFHIIVDLLTQYDAARDQAWLALRFYVFCGLGLWLAIEAGFRAQGWLIAKAIPRLEASIRMHMFEHVQRHSPHYFNDNFAGSLANKISDMTTQVSQILQQILTLFIPGFTACLLAIGFFSQIHAVCATILAIWITFHFLICFAFSKKCDALEQEHGEVRSQLLGKIVDSFTNNFAVNLYYRFAYERSFIAKFQQEEMKKHMQAKRYVEMMRLALGQMTLYGGGIAVNASMFYYWLQGDLTTGAAVQIFNTMWNICMVIWFTGSSIPLLFQSIGIAKQALQIANDPQDILDVPGAVPLVVTKGAITFDNVSFYYGKKQLFKNKHVKIKGGEKVGLVGYSGSGKSSFVNLILRLYPVESGAILIDSQECAKVQLESLRRQIALIPQDPLLFHRTLKENILYGKPEASDEELYDASRLAHCHEFISKLPDGYNSLVGERGTKLSGGERQRIAIARAILANAPILILDEATSALDVATEKCIQESLEWLMQGRTSIVIAHRLSTVAGMDRLLVFDKGKIVEEGTHDQLLELNGHYAALWQLQVGGFLPSEGDEE